MTSHPRQGEAAEEEEESALESAEADFAEQRAELTDPESDWKSSGYSSAEVEASEADAMEQLREVELDEDDYR
ncbi:hypothetical protein [Halostreptopolyspora alba]|uniref:hypothetical protein n=1 Tax=Halostreptopolyspora alba TaxID=2487137 RepID=UPI0011CD839D